MVHSQKNLKIQKNEEEEVFVTPKIFSQVYHYPYFVLLSLIKNSGDSLQIRDYAQKLNLDVKTLETMLDLLIEIKIVRKINNQYQVIHSKMTTSKEAFEKGILKYQREIIKFQAEQIKNISIDLRTVESIVLPFSAKEALKAKKAIQKFINDFQKKFESPLDQHIYSLSIALSPVTEIRKQNE